MSIVITTDALKPSNHAIQQTYSIGPADALYAPVLIDSAGDGESGSMFGASNSRGIFRRGNAIYKLVNRQQAAFKSFMLKSLDNGMTWFVLDSANSPAFESLSGFFTTSICYCVYNAVNGGAGAINFINFDLLTETWGIAYGTVGPPTNANPGNPIVWLRPDSTLFVIYPSRNNFPVGGNSGIGGAIYDLIGAAWVTTFDIGAGLLALAGWDSTQTIVHPQQSNSVMDAGGVLHVFFTTSSLQTVPVIWGNRCFYQQVHLDNSLTSFFDFPGQSVLVGGKQDLASFSGPPLGKPVIVGDIIVLPVLETNRSLIDNFPHELANVYLGTPVATPVWTTNTGTIDPGAITDDTIYPQESPYAIVDSGIVYAIFPAQDADGQNFARLRLCQTSNLADPSTGWTASTPFDLQVNPSSIQFATQSLLEPALGIGPNPVFVYRINPATIPVVILPSTTGAC